MLKYIKSIFSKIYKKVTSRKKLPILRGDESFLEIQIYLEELKNINPLLSNLIKEHIYSRPNTVLSNSLRSSFNQMLSLKRSDKCCVHINCKSKSISSHIISENRLKNYLGNKNKDKITLDVLSYDLKNNPYEFNFCSKTTKSATTFFGYCKDHDRDIFQDLDNIDTIDSIIILNKQFLRILGGEISNINDILEYFKPFCKINKNEKKSKKISLEEAFQDYISPKISNMIARKERALNLYKNIWEGIQNGVPLIKVKTYKLTETSYMFSSFWDLTRETDSDHYFIFIFKEICGKGSYLHIGTLDNNHKNEILNLFEDNSDMTLLELILDKKENFVFSKKFKEGSNVDLLKKNQDLFPYTPIELYLIEEQLLSLSNDDKEKDSKYELERK